MKQFLSVCYIVFMVTINVFSFRDDLKIQGYPLWMLIFNVVANVPGLIVMFMWAFEFEPKVKRFWKVVPFMLVFYYAADWYFDFVIYRTPDMTNRVIVVVTFLGLLLLFPLLYSTFKFGYNN